LLIWCWYLYNFLTIPFSWQRCLIDGTVSSNSPRELWWVGRVVMKIVAILWNDAKHQLVLFNIKFCLCTFCVQCLRTFQSVTDLKITTYFVFSSKIRPRKGFLHTRLLSTTNNKTNKRKCCLTYFSAHGSHWRKKLTVNNSWSRRVINTCRYLPNEHWKIIYKWNHSLFIAVTSRF